jgi:hypothetical protein
MEPLSTAERQQRYRKRALRDPYGSLLTRFQVMLSPTAAANLERIAAQIGQTKRAGGGNAGTGPRVTV